MKGTLITLLVLAGLASAESKSITLPGEDDFTWVAGSNASGIGNGPSSTDVMGKFINAIPTSADKIGWFGGTGQSYGSGDYGSDISITSSNSFTFTCRPVLSGEYVALGIELPEAAQGITLNFTTNNKVGYSVWSYNSTTKFVTQLIANTYVDAAKSVEAGYTTAPVTDDMLFVVWTANHPSGNVGGGKGIAISNISVSYEVPEPATATLSLLALAGLCVRRRRR